MSKNKMNITYIVVYKSMYFILWIFARGQEKIIN